MRLDFELLPGRFALVRLPPDTPAPVWAGGPFWAAIHSAQSLTVICAQSEVPLDVAMEGGYRCMRIAAEFDLASTGVVAAATRPLADAAISVFVQSTWETDFILLKEIDLGNAIRALRAAGHEVDEDRGTSGD